MLECKFIILTGQQLMWFPELLIRFILLEQVILVSRPRTANQSCCSTLSLSDAVRATSSTQTCFQMSYMFSCVFFIALAARPMFLRTSVLVLAFSRASLWNSMVDKVPSIRFSCSSYRFFLFKAWRATRRVEKELNKVNLQRLPGKSIHND